MSKNSISFALVLGLLGCAAPQCASAPSPADLDPLTKEVAELKGEVAHLENQIGHLQTEVSAASAEDELTAMTIDAAQWSDQDGSVSGVFGKGPSLLCHVVEWRGYGKMLRFVRKADPTFTLEAEGHQAVEAKVATGGICNSDGSTRLAVLKVSGVLDPNTRYRLRPRNEKEEYRWSVPDDLVVMAPATSGAQSGPFPSRKLTPAAK